MNSADITKDAKRGRKRNGEPNFVLVAADPLEDDRAEGLVGEVRRADRAAPGNRQSAQEEGSRQGGSEEVEGGAPGSEASSGL